MNPTALETFIRLHAGLQQQGPRSDAPTRQALRRLGHFRPAPRILDLSCGPGRQTLVLARDTGGVVKAFGDGAQRNRGLPSERGVVRLFVLSGARSEMSTRDERVLLLDEILC